jgi:hypothetical protein
MLLSDWKKLRKETETSTKKTNLENMAFEQSTRDYIVDK